jgi:hypothetical protein
MKKYISILLVIFLTIISCTDILDIYPVENNSADQFYKTELEMQQAVIGIYGRLSQQTDIPALYYLQLSESRSDNWFMAQMPNAQRDQADVRRFQVNSQTGLVSQAYNRFYSIIADVNTLLAKSDESYTRFRAEASFLRAYAYFELVRSWGPQPVLLTPTEKQDALKAVRQSEEEVYNQIIKDLLYSIEHLNEYYTGKEAGRVGSWAARTLLAYVYNTMAGYPVNDGEAYKKAVDVLSPVINSMGSRFAPNYTDIFNLNQENKWDLFSVQFSSGGQGLGSSVSGFSTGGGSSTETMFPEWVYSGFTTQGQDFRMDSLVINEMLEADDVRGGFPLFTKGYWNVKNPPVNPTLADSAAHYIEKPYLMIKYLVRDNTNNSIKAWNDYPLNFPILRVSDAYLLYAEALIGVGRPQDAKQWIDKVRVRAGISALESNPTIQDVMEERRKEFLGEGKRYFDLKRQGETIFVQKLKAFSDWYGNVSVYNGSEPTKRDMLLPIPQSVMNIHLGWEQNANY